MNIIKTSRENSGFTQAELAGKTGLSVRTIQRLETSKNPPKGHSLKVLSEVFNLKPSTLQQQMRSDSETKESDIFSLKLINLSILIFFIFPFGNLILPLIIWSKKKRRKLINEAGRRIINIQITWTLALVFIMIASPFIDKSLNSPIPLIFVTLFLMLAINIFIVNYTASCIRRNRFDFLNPPIELF